jgi:hypothetical protein
MAYSKNKPWHYSHVALTLQLKINHHKKPQKTATIAAIVARRTIRLSFSKPFALSNNNKQVS